MLQLAALRREEVQSETMLDVRQLAAGPAEGQGWPIGQAGTEWSVLALQVEARPLKSAATGYFNRGGHGGRSTEGAQTLRREAEDPSFVSRY
jgi:hypothetical protein